MAEQGFITARVFSTDAQLPIEGANVTISQPSQNGTRLLASRLTDRNGNISPIAVDTPDRSESLQAGTPAPFTLVDITVDYPGYERILVENAQVFSGIVTQQNLVLIPLQERPQAWNLTEIFQVSAQNL